MVTFASYLQGSQTHCDIPYKYIHDNNEMLFFILLTLPVQTMTTLAHEERAVYNMLTVYAKPTH